jgi:hypothetical protein
MTLTALKHIEAFSKANSQGHQATTYGDITKSIVYVAWKCILDLMVANNN